MCGSTARPVSWWSRPADGAAALRRAIGAGAALMASEQVGVAQWCLTTTVAYLKERRQFGRPVGGFQALKHRLADLFVAVESAAAAARYAAATLAVQDPDHEVATALAQAYCGEVAVRAAEEAVQLHAGIGMTWEHPAHLYLKRAKADQIAFGTSGAHRLRLAGLVDLPAAGTCSYQLTSVGARVSIVHSAPSTSATPAATHSAESSPPTAKRPSRPTAPASLE